MTLIMTIADSRRTVQVSDRRLTVPNKIYDDEANKAIFVACRNARFTMSYTGIAFLKLGVFLRHRRRVDRWVTNFFSRIGLRDIDISTVFNLLKKETEIEFAGKGITFVATGFVGNTPFVWTLTNIEDNNGRLLADVQPLFVDRVWIPVTDEQRHNAQYIAIHGTEIAFDPVTRYLKN